jgi:UDP-glucose:(heptosyl)LPS alpha-1,3-glucosyltransferase
MKIAIIRRKYTFHGGAEGFSQALIKQLSSAGNEIHIYAIEWENTTAKNIFFHKVPSITFNSFLRDLTFAVFSYFILRKHRKQYDIIQSHDKTMYQDIYRAGDGCHIEWLKQRRQRMGLAGKLSILLNPYHLLILNLEHKIFSRRRYKKIIAISEMVKRNIIDNYGVSSDDIEVIYNGVDTERFHPDNIKKYRSGIRKQYSLSESDFVVLFVGSGFERKGVEHLIKAVESISEPVAVLIVGKGPGNKFKGLIVRQNVIFCGPQKEIEKFYAAADIFVFPAIYEPFGNVHLEALASGLPVITTKNSGAAEIIEDGKNGFAVDVPEDFNVIAERIRFFFDEDKLRSAREHARKTAEKFTFQKHIEKIMSLYKNIASK